MIDLEIAKQKFGEYVERLSRNRGTKLFWSISDIDEFELVWVFRYAYYGENREKFYYKPLIVSKADGAIYIHLGPYPISRVASEFRVESPNLIRLS